MRNDYYRNNILAMWFSRLRKKDKDNLPAKYGQDIFLTFSDIGNHVETVKIVSKGHFDLSSFVTKQDPYLSSIIVTSTGAVIDDGMELGFSLSGPGLHGTDFIRLKNYLINPSTAVIDLQEEELLITHDLIVTFDSPSDTLLFITFVTRDQNLNNLVKICEFKRQHDFELHNKKHP